MIHYLFKIAGQPDHHKQTTQTRFYLQPAANEAAYLTDLRQPYGGNQTVEVKCFRLEIDNSGKLREHYIASYDCPITQEPINEEQYCTEQTVLLGGIPEEFRGVLAGYAWDKGHSVGYEEVLLYLRELISTFQPAIEAFAKRIG